MLNAIINSALSAVNPATWQTNEGGQGNTVDQGNGIGDGMNGMGNNMDMQQFNDQMNGMADAAAGVGIGVMLVWVILMVITLAGMWKVVSKAGHPGILGIIPIVNWFFFAQVAGKPTWWGVLMLVPIVNLVVGIIILLGISERLGRGIGTAIGLFILFFIFWPILGFGSAKWTPPPAAA